MHVSLVSCCVQSICCCSSSERVLEIFALRVGKRLVLLQAHAAELAQGICCHILALARRNQICVVEVQMYPAADQFIPFVGKTTFCAVFRSMLR